MGGKSYMPALLLIIAFPLLWALCGCSRKVLEVERLVEHTDTLYRESVRIERDTLRIADIREITIRDSIAPNVDSTGRVLGFDRWHWEVRDLRGETQRSRVQIERDTVNHVASSAATTREVVKIPQVTERKLTWWERTCIRFAPWLSVALLAALAWIFRAPLITLARRLI